MGENFSSDVPDPVVERVARAIWDAHRKREIEDISTFEFDCSLFIKTAEILRDAAAREVAIVGFSLISECLNAALRFHLSHSSKRDQADLLNGLGPLSTDAARLRLVRVLGWLPEITAAGVDDFRKARNDVAHQLLPNDEIDIVAYLHPPTKHWLDDTISRMVEAAQEHEEEDLSISPVDLPKAYSLLLSSHLLEDLMGGAARLRLGLQDQKSRPFYSFDEAPSWARDVRRDVARAVFIVAGHLEVDGPNEQSLGK